MENKAREARFVDESNRAGKLLTGAEEAAREIAYQMESLGPIVVASLIEGALARLRAAADERGAMLSQVRAEVTTDLVSERERLDLEQRRLANDLVRAQVRKLEIENDREAGILQDYRARHDTGAMDAKVTNRL